MSLFVILGLFWGVDGWASSVVIDLQGLPEARLVGRTGRSIAMRLRARQIQYGSDLFLDRLQVLDDGRVRLFVRFIEISQGHVLGVGAVLRIDLQSLDEYNRHFNESSSARVSREAVAALFVALRRPQALLGPNPHVTGAVDPVAHFNLENGTLFTRSGRPIFPRSPRHSGCSSYFAGESELELDLTLVDSMLEP